MAVRRLSYALLSGAPRVNRSGGNTYHRRWLRQQHERTAWDVLLHEGPEVAGDAKHYLRVAAYEHAVPAVVRARLDALIGRVLRQRRPLTRIDEQVYPAGTLWRVESRQADRLLCVRQGDRDGVLVLMRAELLGAVFA